MSRSPLVRVAIVLTLSILLGACGKKDSVIVDGFRHPYPAPNSPQNVLTSMAMAYSARDTVETKLVYDESYQGISSDLSVPPPIPAPPVFFKSGEVAHVAALARNAGVTNVILELAPTLIRYSDASDPPGWATIGDPITRIEIYDANTAISLRVDLSRETMTFKFVPQTPDSTSPTDTTWKIIRWFELKN